MSETYWTRRKVYSLGLALSLSAAAMTGCGNSDGPPKIAKHKAFLILDHQITGPDEAAHSPETKYYELMKQCKHGDPASIDASGCVKLWVNVSPADYDYSQVKDGQYVNFYGEHDQYGTPNPPN